MAGRAAAYEFGFMGAELERGAEGFVQDHARIARGVPPDQGEGLRGYLIKEFRRGRMTSEQVCTLSWHATAAGGTGVADLAVKPTLTHQAEHLRLVMNARAAETFYVAAIPMWCHHEEVRKFTQFPFDLPHEAFARMHAQDPTCYDVQPHMHEELPPSFWEHEVFAAKGDMAHPLGFFSGAVPHTKKDSFFAFYWGSLVDRKRHLICALRKADLCQCGCRGFCTLSSVQNIIAYSFQCLAEGKHPQLRHDLLPFDRDPKRHAQCGRWLAEGKCGALVEMRADLLEYVSALGFRQWQDCMRPCFLCDSSRADLFNFPPSITMPAPWRSHDPASYDNAVQQAVLKRRVTTPVLLQRLVGLLRFDLRKGSPAGLHLRESLPELDLPKGARLVEDGVLVDIHALEDVALPADLTFFHTAGNHGLNFVCPLFKVPGFNISCLTLDVMHVLDLGVSQYLAGALFMTLIKNNFANSDVVYVDMQRRHNMIHLRRRMSAYYKTQRRPRGQMSQIGKLTLPMLSSLRLPRLKSKAAECRNLIPLLPQLCTENPGCLSGLGAHLQICCFELARFYRIMQAEPRRMSPGGLHDLQSSMSRFLTHWKLFGGHVVFKHHCAWHMVERAAWHGNPKYYWTYADEQENRVMKSVAQSLHGGNTFYLTFLQKVLPEVD